LVSDVSAESRPAHAPPPMFWLWNLAAVPSRPASACRSMRWTTAEAC